jgi:hypothetical protein
MQIEREFP